MTPERRAVLDRLAARCPRLHVGDVWAGVFSRERVEILAFDRSYHDEGYPWPGVVVHIPGDDQQTIGAPAFTLATLVTRGTGASWEPPAAAESEAA